MQFHLAPFSGFSGFMLVWGRAGRLSLHGVDFGQCFLFLGGWDASISERPPQMSRPRLRVEAVDLPADSPNDLWFQHGMEEWSRK